MRDVFLAFCRADWWKFWSPEKSGIAGGAILGAILSYLLHIAQSQGWL